MRPIRLELKGFTAFRDPQSVDFADLDLFAVSGPTGSGKSSILDAMTYALYGYVERVGRQCSQLISQGQPRMAVTFEFAVGDRRFRVARSTPAKGPTRILLERWEDGWRQAGEGADRVRDADAMIRDAVGLDYEAFTRSVLLPQGRFAEFLVGDAKDRRDILTELLGLELFERLARTAGEMKRTAAAEAEAGEHLLQTEYAGVTADVVEGAEMTAEEAAAREEALAVAEDRVRQMADRWAETVRVIGELSTCAKDAEGAAAIAARSARALQALAATQAEAEAVATERSKMAAAAERAAKRAKAAWARAESKWGRAGDLGALRARAEELAGARDDLGAVEAELEGLRKGRPSLVKAASGARQLLETRAANAEAAILVLDAAMTALDEAQHADLVAAVRAGVRRGDVCPVCGAMVASLPKGGRVRSLEKARAAHAKAQERAAAANRAVEEARLARDAAESALRDLNGGLQLLDGERTKRRKGVAALETTLAQAFGGKLPPDPAATLEDRALQLEAMEAAMRAAAEEVSEAKDLAALAERERSDLSTGLAEERGQLAGVPATALVERARALGVISTQDVPRIPRTNDAAALSGVADALAGGLSSLADGLDRRAAELAEGESDLLSEAASVVEGLAEPTGSLAELARLLADSRRKAAADSATAAHEAEALRTKLENTRALGERIAGQRVRSQRFDALAKELRADRIIAFLQLEALQILASAGSEHLATLSDGRYRLAYQGDEFFVVDTWNGDEQRSARTLSGGETFLASLALALALSEQVRSLSLTEKARLDSLFLDEGFGALDPETLETVVDAIEQLGGDGRMVGVVTHVQELAIRLPTRIEVEKSPRGSRLQVVR
ncbi:MAG: SMC family ATPase [Actinomycetota bacterium]